jgi:uncharacterized SAM-binding protein YcdF (DUF218 family)
MFFIISKILSFLISPFTWIITLLLLGVLLKNKKAARKFLISCVIVSLFFSNSFIADGVYGLWESPITTDTQLIGTYDAGIVLGGGMVTIDAQTKRMTFRNNTDRFFQALSLYKNGKIKKILLSSGSGSLVYRDMLEASLLKKYMISIGIPDSVVLVDSLSDNTFQNAKFSKKILDEKFPKGKFLLITSSIHMKRALACFEKAGVKVTPYCTNRLTGKQSYDLSHILVPNIGAISTWDGLIHEVFGYVMYFVMGYL